MATITHNGGSGGHIANSPQPYLLEVLVNAAEVANDVTIGTTDTIQVLKIPAKTFVSFAGVDVLKVEGTNTSSKYALGDGSDTARFVDAVVLTALGPLTQAATAETGVMYNTADTIDILISVDDPTDAIARVWAICTDFSMLNTTVDDKTYS